MEKNDNCFSLAENRFLQMTDFLKSNEASSLNYRCVENYLQKDGRELLRDLLNGHIKERGRSYRAKCYRSRWYKKNS